MDKITEDCFFDHYPSYISNGLSTALSIVNDNLKELKNMKAKINRGKIKNESINSL